MFGRRVNLTSLHEVGKTAVIYGLRRNGGSEYRYVGQSKNLINRMYTHAWRASREYHDFPVHEWFAQHLYSGVTADILAEIPVGKHVALDRAERELIEAIRADGDRLLNVVDGGQGLRSYKGRRRSNRYSVTWTPERRAAILAQPANHCIVFSIKNSPEHRQALIDNHRDVAGDKNPFYGKKHTEEARTRIRESHSQRTPEERAALAEKMRDAHQRRSPEERALITMKRQATRESRTPEQQAAVDARFKNAMTEERRQKARQTQHTRWHTNRNISNPACGFCTTNTNESTS